MADLRVGVIGIGSMGRHHVRNVRETPGLQLVALADPAGDKFEVAGDLEVGRGVEDLIKAGIDAAVVAVPTGYHEEVAIALAQAGVHTLIEKPLAQDVAAGERIAAAFAAAGVIGAVGYVERCNPAILEMRRRIAAGQLGEIYQIVTRRQGPFPARIADVGVIKDLATHDVDLTAWVAGSQYASIYAQATRKSGREHEDMVVATGRLQNGTLVNHVVNWYSPFKERTTVVTGEKGSLVADTMTGDLTYYANGTVAVEWDQIAAVRGVSEGEVTRYAVTKREPLRVEHENFRDAIVAGGTDYVPLSDAVATLRVLDAMSAAAGGAGAQNL